MRKDFEITSDLILIEAIEHESEAKLIWDLISKEHLEILEEKIIKLTQS